MLELLTLEQLTAATVTYCHDRGTPDGRYYHDTVTRQKKNPSRPETARVYRTWVDQAAHDSRAAFMASIALA